MSGPANRPSMGLRVWNWCWVMMAGVLAMAFVNVCIGVTGIYSPLDVLRAVADSLGLGADSTPALLRLIIVEYRLPVTITAMLAGASLALAGALTQGIFRNPLAAPSVIGVTAGGGLGGVLTILLIGLGAAGLTGLRIADAEFVPKLLLVPMGAFAGALLATALVYALATRHGETHVPTLLLAGIAVNALAAAGTGLILALSFRDPDSFRTAFFWQMGSLEHRNWWHVLILLPGTLLGILGGLLYSRELNLLALGERSAISLGVDVRRVKRHIIVLAALLAGSTVSVIGLIGFIGLVVPHILRLILGPDHRLLLPASVFGGAAFLLLMDLVQRLICVGWLRAPELRVGTLMGLIGGAFFIYLLLAHRHTD